MAGRYDHLYKSFNEKWKSVRTLDDKIAMHRDKIVLYWRTNPYRFDLKYKHRMVEEEIRILRGLMALKKRTTK